MTDAMSALVSGIIGAPAADDCWRWGRALTPNGYGRLRIRGEHVYAHRLSWELHRCEIPEGLVVDHLCHTRDCVNPWHMDLTTRDRNSRRKRGVALDQTGAVKACPKGHPYSAFARRRGPKDNLTCHACAMDRQRARRNRLKESR